MKKTKNRDNSLILITSFICILPVIFGLIVYNDLPEGIAIHFNSSGTPDNIVPKPLAVFGIPVLFLVVNLISKFRLFYDPNKEKHSLEMRRFSIWAIPILSVITVIITLLIALGVDVSINLFGTVLFGIVVVFCGNYLPKSRKNYTMGLKLPWTLDDADNWNKTHLFAGYLYVLGGIGIVVFSFLPANHTTTKNILFTTIVFALLIVPRIYSFALFRFKKKSYD